MNAFTDFTKTDSGFCTEISDMKFATEVQCPGCQRTELRTEFDARAEKWMTGQGEDEELGGWKVECPFCKATITIFND